MWIVFLWWTNQRIPPPKQIWTLGTPPQLLIMNCTMQVHLCATFLKSNKVNWLMTEHLSVQGRQDPRGGLCCFWCPNKTWTPFTCVSGSLKIVRNGIELRKLQTPHWTLQRMILKYPKNSLYVALLLLEFKMIWRTLGDAPIVF
jgi:hypothetical protein